MSFKGQEWRHFPDPFSKIYPPRGTHWAGGLSTAGARAHAAGWSCSSLAHPLRSDLPAAHTHAGPEALQVSIQMGQTGFVQAAPGAG